MFDRLDEILQLPKNLPSAIDRGQGSTISLDGRLCSALLAKSDVIGPMLCFCITHAVEAPMSDMEWVAFGAAQSLNGLWGSRVTNAEVAVIPHWPDTG